MTKVVLDWPGTTVIMVLALTAILAVQIAHLEINTDTEAFIPPEHPATLNNNRMKETFGTPDLLWIGVFREDRGVYQPDTLALIRDLTEKIRLIPGISDQDVVSLATEDDIRGTADGMDVKPFMRNVPDSAEQLRKLARAVHDFDMYDGFIVSKDEKAAAILAELEPEALLKKRGLDKYAVYMAVKQAVDSVSINRPEKIYVAGLPVAEATLGRYIQEDMSRMIPLVIAALMVLLFFTYRSVRGVLIPMLVVVLSVVASMGIMAAAGVPMYPTSTMVPITLMAIGVADSIHILGKYYEIALCSPVMDRRAIVLEAMDEMNMPVILTSLTTAVGFLSFLTMEMVPLKMMGIFAAIGILYAMLLSLTLVPALLMMMPVHAPKGLREHAMTRGLRHAGLISYLMSRQGRWIAAHAIPLLIMASIILFGCAYFASMVYVDDAYTANFQPDSPVILADHQINRHFIGSYQRNLLLKADHAGAFYDPEVLRAMWRFQKALERKPYVGGTMSLADYIRRMNRVMHEDRKSMARIPDSSNLIAQYLLLYSFSGSPDDFSEVVTGDYSEANIRIFSTTDDYLKSDTIEQAINRLANRYFAGKGVTWVVAGNAHIGHTQVKMITDNLRINIVATVLAIFLFAWMMFRSLVAGLFVMVPVLAAVIFNFAIMGISGTTIGWGSSMFTSIAICIGVDYAIHFIYKFRRQFEMDRDEKTAMEISLATTGKTILFNAVVVIAGFMALLASRMPPNQEMGFLVSVAMFSSFAATLTVLPALILTAKPKFIYGGVSE